MAKPTIQSSYGGGGKTLTTTAQENPNLVGNANLLRALTQDRKSDYEGRRLGRESEVHKMALAPRPSAGAQQMRALTAPTVQAPRADYPNGPRRSVPTERPEPTGMMLPLRPGTGALPYQGLSWGSGISTNPLDIERGYILI